MTNGKVARTGTDASVWGSPTTFLDIWWWRQELKQLHARIAPYFARTEPRRRAFAYLKGLQAKISIDHLLSGRQMRRIAISAVFGDGATLRDGPIRQRTRPTKSKRIMHRRQG
ncbi:hypothetical protein [Ktedonospora formicarum]|uniref:hypothetical protein n=1 Tax=Ktedonospora formicarum TaxID=2778364 RepID=UPI001F229904|nr:hypothetical protein [Ktedonospora formicarum]